MIVGTCYELGIKLAEKYSQASGLYLGSNEILYYTSLIKNQRKSNLHFKNS